MDNCYPRKDQRAMLISNAQFAALEKYIEVNFGSVHVHWHSRFASQEIYNFISELEYSSYHVMFENIAEIPKEVLQQFPFWVATIGAPQLEQFDLTQYDAESDQFISVEIQEPPKADVRAPLPRIRFSHYQVQPKRPRKRKHGAQVRPSRHLNKTKRFVKCYTADFEDDQLNGTYTARMPYLSPEVELGKN